MRRPLAGAQARMRAGEEAAVVRRHSQRNLQVAAAAASGQARVPRGMSAWRTRYSACPRFTAFFRQQNACRTRREGSRSCCPVQHAPSTASPRRADRRHHEYRPCSPGSEESAPPLSSLQQAQAFAGEPKENPGTPDAHVSSPGALPGVKCSPRAPPRWSAGDRSETENGRG